MVLPVRRGYPDNLAEGRSAECGRRASLTWTTVSGGRTDGRPATIHTLAFANRSWRTTPGATDARALRQPEHGPAAAGPKRAIFATWLRNRRVPTVDRMLPLLLDAATGHMQNRIGQRLA